VSKQYYIRLRGKVRGPFPAEKLRELARRGQFSRIYQVSSDGSKWEPARNHPELLPPAKSLKTRRSADPSRGAEAGRELADSDEVVLEMVEGETPPPRSDSDDWPRQLTWYYAKAGREVGPLFFGDLRNLALRGELSYNDCVWAEGMSEWMEAFSIPGLFSDQEFSGLAKHTGRYGARPGSEPRAGPMAMASLICGILGVTICPGIASLPALACSHLALQQIREQGNLAGGQGVTKAGMILGYVGLGLGLLFFLTGFVLAVLSLFADPDPLAG